MIPLNERLREVPNAKMLIDVVQINGAAGAGQLRKAVQFVCGNTLVCETIKEARSVAFDRQERNKVSVKSTTAQDIVLITHAALQLNVCFAILQPLVILDNKLKSNCSSGVIQTISENVSLPIYFE